MYAQDMACVFTAEGLSETFACSIGVKQGCPLSPNLFGLFVDGIEKIMLEMTCDAPQLGTIHVPLLLFADDLSLVSNTLVGLQQQLDALHSYCTQFGLTVNIAKTKTLIFHMRESTPADTLYFDNKPIDRVQSFRYLGAHFHATKGFSYAAEQLLVSANKAMHALHRRCINLHIDDVLLKTRLFDALVAPVLNYACEIWAVDLPLTSKPPQEQLHTQFLKRLLGVSQHANDANVRGEFGRHPIAFFWLQMLIKYYNRLCSIPDYRVLHHAFQEMRQMYSSPSHTCWLSKFAAMLDHIFGEHSEYVCNVRDGVPIDGWKAALAESRSNYILQQRNNGSIISATYWSLKPAVQYAPETYLSVVENRHDRRTLAMLRTGAHWLQIQQGRFTATPRNLRSCLLCNSGVVEDEAHMIYRCLAYDSLRSRFSNLFQHCSIVAANDRTLATFLDNNKSRLIAVAQFLELCRILNKQTILSIS
jgi:hypothetical protein